MRMLWRRSASLTRMTRRSFPIARIILRRDSAFWAATSERVTRPILVTPSTRWATESPKRSRISSMRRHRVLDGVVEEPGGHRLLVEVPVGEENRRRSAGWIRYGSPDIAHLPVVHLGGEDVRLVDELDVRGRAGRLHPVDDVKDAEQERIPRPGAICTRTFPWAISRSAMTVGFSFRAVVSIVAPAPAVELFRALGRDHRELKMVVHLPQAILNRYSSHPVPLPLFRRIRPRRRSSAPGAAAAPERSTPPAGPRFPGRRSRPGSRSSPVP